MVVAFPIVSHASSTLIKLLSFIIFCVEYARESVTANGRPSGTATTTMVTPMIKAFKQYSNRVWPCSLMRRYSLDVSNRKNEIGRAHV